MPTFYVCTCKGSNNGSIEQAFVSFFTTNDLILQEIAYLCTNIPNDTYKRKTMKRHITKNWKQWAMATILLVAQESVMAQTQVVLETTMGNIRLELNEKDTPLHSKNFKELVEKGFYDSLLFHRLAFNFVIQAGDPNSKDAEPGILLGNVEEPYSVPAEIRFPELIHKRGALCMAREGDANNPERVSSAYQFYIVYGRLYDDAMLDKIQERLDTTTNGQVILTPEIREIYKTQGGLPYLDGQYTVFGEVVEGLDVVMRMQTADVDKNARPLNDIRILRAYIAEE